MKRGKTKDITQTGRKKEIKLDRRERKKPAVPLL